MTIAARLLGHPYIIIARVGQSGELEPPGPLKLLPPAGRYDVFVNGSKEVLTMGENGTLTIETLPKFSIGEELLISFF
jgi:hypothetical protein